jgi:predicted transcriptional regulator
MKSVMISIKPKWCELIANGKKTIEIRKTRPKIDTPFRCYIYCTKEKDISEILWTGKKQEIGKISDKSNGKVIGDFVCDEIYTIDCDSTGFFYKGKQGYIKKELEYNSCLSEGDIFSYLFPNVGYGWHISELKIYDEPKSLKYFYHYGVKRGSKVTRPPQSWCYVDELR